MTPEEFANRMQEWAGAKVDEPDGFYYQPNDEEIAHGEADELMREALRALGYGEGVEIFERMRKWYA